MLRIDGANPAMTGEASGPAQSLETDALAIAFDGARLHLWTAPPGEGTPTSIGSEGHFAWAWLGANGPALDARVVERIFRDPSRLSSLPEAWALFARNARTGQTIVATDRLGIQHVYWRHDGGRFFASTNLMWLLSATGHDGSYDPEGLADHLCLGHSINGSDQLYAGVRRLEPATAGRLTRDGFRVSAYWLPRPEGSTESFDAGALRDVLREAAEAGGRESYFGLTAGKDSLCIASAARPAKSFTFGDVDSADQHQGRMAAGALGWEHRRATICGAPRFRKWVDWIALHSAGLTTASYADMLDAVDLCIPPGGAFVMGCGSGSVRNTWPAAHARNAGPELIDNFADRFTTPWEFLSETLREAPDRRRYPERAIEKAGLRNGSPARAMKEYYRYRRMPGNFGQRHSIIAPLRTKLAPFCHSRFIDLTYGLATPVYDGFGIHRAVIEHCRPAMMPFLDHPVTGGASVQGLAPRIEGPLGREMEDIFEEALPYAPACWNRAGIFRLLRARPLPARAPYYLLRLVPLAAAARMLRNPDLRRMFPTGQASGKGRYHGTLEVSLPASLS